MVTIVTKVIYNKLDTISIKHEGGNPTILSNLLNSLWGFKIEKLFYKHTLRHKQTLSISLIEALLTEDLNENKTIVLDFENF